MLGASRLSDEMPNADTGCKTQTVRYHYRGSSTGNPLHNGSTLIPHRKPRRRNLHCGMSAFMQNTICNVSLRRLLLVRPMDFVGLIWDKSNKLVKRHYENML